MSINSLLRWFLTLLIIVIACVFCYIRYNAYFRNPWTRDGMVQAEVVQVAARVSGGGQDRACPRQSICESGRSAF